MLWVEAFLLFAVSHLVGDFILQTDWQAHHKHGGLGRNPTSRRALISHVATYTLAFVPASSGSEPRSARPARSASER